MPIADWQLPIVSIPEGVISLLKECLEVEAESANRQSPIANRQLVHQLQLRLHQLVVHEVGQRESAVFLDKEFRGFCR